MLDIFFIKQLSRLLHAPICLYSQAGAAIQEFGQTGAGELIGAKDFGQVAWKYTDGREKGFVCAGDPPTAIAFPYIHVEESGIAFCLMQTEKEGVLAGLGKLRIYPFADGESRKYPYCGKDEFIAIISILWKMLSGQEAGSEELWEANVSIGYNPREQLARGIFAIQEEGVFHRPYALELWEHDCIRRGDAEALKRSMGEGNSSGKAGKLAHDTVRQYKNAAICVIACAARSAAEGGVNPERAFSMADHFILNIEENLADPLKIERAMREAQFEFAHAVRHFKESSGSPLVDQVNHYVFCHIHEPILVKDIADYIGVTPNYLSGQFRKTVGMPLKQYIIDEKIASSEQLLKYTDYSLQEISSFCAFSSQSRFCAYFERKYGITPAKYRKKYGKLLR